MGMNASRGECIAMVGAGNVACALALSLSRAGYRMVSVYSRRPERAACLASRVGAEAKSGGAAQVVAADIAIVAVPDSAILPIMEELDGQVSLVLHTSGATPLVGLNRSASGVLYPLQTFTEGREVALGKVPIFVEASSESAFARLEGLANRLSGLVIPADSDRRLRMHLLGVLTNNYGNLLLRLAEELIEGEGFSLDLLLPLLRETLEKSLALTPRCAQTGPARRGDAYTQVQHARLLAAEHPDMLSLYNLMAQMIAEREWGVAGGNGQNLSES